MKNLFYLLFLSLITLLMLPACEQDEPEIDAAFFIKPENPKPGEEITVYYDPDSSNLAEAEEIEMIVYQYSDDLDEAKGIVMRESLDYYKASFQSSENSLGAIITFEGNDLLDNNMNEGYVIHFYGEDNDVLPGSLAGLGVAYNTWGSYYLDLERDREKALSLFEQEFEKNPKIKNDFIEPYLLVVSSVKPDDADKIYNNEIERIEKNENKTEEEITVLINFYTEKENDEKVTELKQQLEELYPESEFLQVERYREIRNESDPVKALALTEQFEKDYPDSKYKVSAYDVVANKYRDNKEFNKTAEFLEKYKDKVHPYRFYSVVIKMLEEDDPDLTTTLEIAKLGVDRNRREIRDPLITQEKYETEKKYQEAREYILGLNLYAYGKVLYEQDKIVNAVPILEEAVNTTDGEEGDINELYVTALYQTEKYDEAMSKIESFISDGKGTSVMKELLKKSYTSAKGNESGFDEYAAKFYEKAKENLTEELQAKMISEPAPGFTLTDLKGNKVSLSEFKDKVVVLDFWATWCGPCIASFPGLQKIVDAYIHEIDVKFLFINAWERVDNKKENAEKFMKENNYTFHVLLDDENSVIEKYKVSGIPTKFVIDKDGNIRFKSVGFQGSADQLVEELSTMIEMLRDKEEVN